MASELKTIVGSHPRISVNVFAQVFKLWLLRAMKKQVYIEKHQMDKFQKGREGIGCRIVTAGGKAIGNVNVKDFLMEM